MDEVPAHRSRPMEAVPLRTSRVEEKVAEDGTIHLCAHVPPRGWMEKCMAKVAGTDKTIQVALDEHGTFFWTHIDGKKNLFTLSALVRKEFELSKEDSDQATILFIKMLMRRNLIYLQVHPRRRGGKRKAENG